MANTNEKTQDEMIKSFIDSNEEIATAIQSLNDGDFYSDKIVDSLADIALSLRIIAGRQKLIL